MANKIVLKNSETISAAPVVGDLVAGEIAANLIDGRIFSKTAGGVITQIGNAVKYIEFILVEKTTDVTAVAAHGGDFRLPFPGVIVDAGAYVDTAGTTGTTNIDINIGGVSIFSTVITIDSTEKTSSTALAPRVINAATDNYTTDAIITIDVDSISTTAPKGLKVWFTIKET